MFILDTDMCIYLMNVRNDALLERFEANSGQIAISAITYAELAYGVAHSKRVKHNECELEAFTHDLDVLPFDQPCGDEYGGIRQALTKKGAMIGGNDLFIAAHARAIRAILVTNNEREFQRVPKLRLENWLKEAQA